MNEHMNEAAYLSLCWAEASNRLSWARRSAPTAPEPLVVRSTVSSCISTAAPSAVKLRSRPTPLAPFLLAYRQRGQETTGEDETWEDRNSCLS